MEILKLPKKETFRTNNSYFIHSSFDELSSDKYIFLQSDWIFIYSL
jgi:hypothetical protein